MKATSQRELPFHCVHCSYRARAIVDGADESDADANAQSLIRMAACPACGGRDRVAQTNAWSGSLVRIVLIAIPVLGVSALVGALLPFPETVSMVLMLAVAMGTLSFFWARQKREWSSPDARVRFLTEELTPGEKKKKKRLVAAPPPPPEPPPAPVATAGFEITETEHPLWTDATREHKLPGRFSTMRTKTPGGREVAIVVGRREGDGDALLAAMRGTLAAVARGIDGDLEIKADVLPRAEPVDPRFTRALVADAPRLHGGPELADHCVAIVLFAEEADVAFVSPYRIVGRLVVGGGSVRAKPRT